MQPIEQRSRDYILQINWLAVGCNRIGSEGPALVLLWLSAKDCDNFFSFRLEAATYLIIVPNTFQFSFSSTKTSLIRERDVTGLVRGMGDSWIRSSLFLNLNG